jgi:hypothetical protein
MICGVTRTCYSAPCRWYPGGPIGRIRWYRCDANAKPLPFPTVFWPYNQVLDLTNTTDTGEITGRGLRVYDKGTNFNALQGDHYEGTAADFAGLGVP